MNGEARHTVELYGRQVHLEPLAPGEIVEDVVVVARTRGPNGPAHTFTAAQDQDGAPRTLDAGVRYLVDLGMDQAAANARAGHRPD